MLLLELMISLAISVTLLVAIAAAFSATSAAIETNAHFFTATQAARVSMNLLLSKIRCSDSCFLSGYDGASSSWTSTAVSITDPSGQTTIYQYSSDVGQVQLTQTGGNFNLASNVTDLSFTADYEPDPQSPSHALRVVRVTVDMTVTVGRENIRLTGSAVPRNTVVYK
jgi:Tfp pilus assembly protein PilW